INVLVASIQGAIDVKHPEVALAHVLRGEAEHMVVEPVTTHGFAPVSGDFRDAAAAVGTSGPEVGGVRVDGVTPGEDDGPVVIVELAGEKVGARETVVLRTVMAVVFVGRDRVPAKSPVLRDVGGQPVVVAEKE